MPLKSLLWRIVILHIVAVAVAAILLRSVLFWSLESDVGKLQQNTMRAQTERFARHLVPSAGGWSLNLPARMRDQYSDAYGRYKYAIIDGAGQVLFSSQASRQPLFPTGSATEPITFYKTRTPGGAQTISGASARKTLDGQAVWVQVAEDLAHRDVIVDDVVTNFFQQVIWTIVPVLLLLLAADIVIFRLAIRPLHRASDRARHISPTRIDVRLPTDDMPPEILPLVEAVNQAFDRLERGFHRQREFAADAAHELRTPLAILRTRIDTLPDSEPARALGRDVESMSRVVSQLLDAAELETIVVDPAETADLRQICIEVAEFIAPLALRQGKTIELISGDAPVPIGGNAEMIRRAVRNLAENALNHAPAATAVEVIVDPGGTVSVLDRGEGVPPADRERIFQRLWRRDHHAVGGAGLGLSIVKRIVEAHGAMLGVDNRPGGGASFSIRFRPAAAGASTRGGPPTGLTS
jgi:signal transduction histidine kinase